LRVEESRSRQVDGWVRPEDLAILDRLDRLRPRPDRAVLLSPFDPLLWDRARVRVLFGFDQVLEIFKPAGKRLYGYYCLPVLAGERLIARVDLKCQREKEHLRVLSCRHEGEEASGAISAADREAVRRALEAFSASIGTTSVSFGVAGRPARKPRARAQTRPASVAPAQRGQAEMSRSRRDRSRR